jgi:hypothetical protein
MGEAMHIHIQIHPTQNPGDERISPNTDIHVGF